MANLYSTPAEAQFINTYVPIQFEQLNRLSATAEKNIERGAELMDQLYSYQSLGSMSDAANKAWDERVFSPIKKFIDENVRDPRDLSNPAVLSGLMKLKREIAASGDVKALLESREAYKETVKAADPRWGDAYERMIKTHNPLESGIWSEKPLAYTDWRAMGETYTKFLEPKLKGKDGLNDIYGIDESDIRSVIRSNMSAISSDPSVSMRSNMDLSSLPPEVRSKYEIKDSDGNIIGLDSAKYAEDAIVASVQDKLVQERKFSQERAHYMNYNLQVAKLREQQRKEDASRLQGMVSEHWLRESQLGAMEKGISAVSSIIGSETAGKTPEESYKYTMSKYGPGLANYMKAKSDMAVLSSRRSFLLESMSNAAASGDTNSASAAKDALSKIDSEISAKKQEMSYHMPSAVQSIRTMAADAIIGKVGPDRRPVSPIPREVAIAINVSDAPSEMAENWAELNLGSKTYINTAKGRRIDGYSPTTSSGFRLVEPKTMMPASSVVGGLGQDTESKINKALSDGTLSGSIVLLPTTKTIVDDEGARILSYALVPVDDLKRIGVSDGTINHIGDKYGSEYAKPVVTSPSPYNVGEPTTELTKYVKVPVSSSFVSSDPNSTGNILLNRKYADSKYRQQFDLQ